VGFLVAPLLFAVLDDRALAGRVAGVLFRAEFYVTLAAAPLVVACELALGRRIGLLAGPVLIVAALAVIELVLQPRMQAAQAAEFAWLHGTASVLYLLASLGGLALVLTSRAQRDW
jgi:hypothetical protein